jgi:hypothetical protein
LIVQNENGRFRLKKEFSELDSTLLDRLVRVSEPPPFGLIFDDSEFREDLSAIIAEFRPDLVIIDPWNAAARDEKARNYQDTFNLIRQVVPAGDDGPAIGIVAHTRKPQSDERVNGRALLNLLAGSKHGIRMENRSLSASKLCRKSSLETAAVWHAIFCA